jgi:hypothetical protein
MGVFRSEKFILKKIRIPRESAAEVLNELGKLEDCLEFIDLNKDDSEGKKNFSSMVKRCEEMDKKIG